MKFTYYYMTNFLNKQEIKKINSLVNKIGVPFHRQAPTVKTSTCHSFSFEKLGQIKDFKKALLWINREAFGFNLFSETIDPPIRNIYSHKHKGQYKWHFDAEAHTTNYTTKLTALFNLSEKPYKGGDFYLLDGKELLIKELSQPGTLFVFPSFYLHKVTPVTKGERITGTIFMTGPKWK